MQLKTLVADTPYVIDSIGDMDTEIKKLNIDSRIKTEQGLFFCFKGAAYDSHLFAEQAIANGNIALVVEKYIENLNVPQILVKTSRGAMARMAASFFAYPQKNKIFIGITGTKGKTTTSFMIKSIFEAANYKVGLIGTTGNMIGDKHFDSKLTTPDPIELYETLHRMDESGVEVVVMEVSAHAIDMLRLDGLEFNVGCYTNLSQDHLDYFSDMENYFLAKKKFFTSGFVKNAIFNADEDTSKRIIEGLSIPHICFGIGANADVYARNIEILETGASFNIHLGNIENFDINMKLTGNFNVYNALCAASAAMVLDIDYKYIKMGLENVKVVPGRIESIDTHTNFKLILDYSHSPDSLQNILVTVKEFTRNRLILVFGCGGDRDHSKRPLMGKIAGKYADVTIITSDNPRMEDPLKIIQSIEDGIKLLNAEYSIIEDRREAIRHALNIADDGDIILLAGKGHETYQERKGIRYPFDEKIIVRELLNELREKRG